MSSAQGGPLKGTIGGAPLTPPWHALPAHEVLSAAVSYTHLTLPTNREV